MHDLHNGNLAYLLSLALLDNVANVGITEAQLVVLFIVEAVPLSP